MRINNTELKSLFTTDINALNIEKPEIQRIIDNIKVDNIVNFQLDFYKKYNCFNFTASGPINIHKLSDKYLLVDGQHRLAAIEKLYKQHSHNIENYVLIVHINSIEELEYNYDMINQNTPLPDFSNFQKVDKTIHESVLHYFQNEYPKIWSKNSRARRPHIFFNHFQTALVFICEHANIKNHDILKNILLDYNEKLSKWSPDVFKQKCNVNNNQYELAKEYGIYFGLFAHQNEDYGYQWAKKIVEDLTGKTIKSSNTISKKKKIPKGIKNDSWDKYIGANIAIVNCICCNKTQINMKDFVAGHIVSEKNGGEISVANIIPICLKCNSSMGTKNMDEYIQEFYSENVEAFNNKTYTSPQIENNNNNNNNKVTKLWAYFS